MSKKGFVIGIMGKIGSGKSTVANYIKTKGYVEYSLAGPLKKIGEIFQFSNEELYGTQEQKLGINKYWGISGRYFMQKFGSEICRYALPKHIPEMKMESTPWVKLFEIECQKRPNVNFVVSDVRFEDEALSIKSLGGILIKIQRKVDKSGNENKHVSEVEMEKIKPDYVIENNGSLEELYAKVDEVVV